VARATLQVLPTQLMTDPEGKVLRVKLIQKESECLCAETYPPRGQANHDLFDLGVAGKTIPPVFLFDQGSTVTWIPCGTKLTCEFPGTSRFIAVSL
jgi:phosphoribulokinase